MNNAVDLAKPIRLLVLDVDGILTDGSLYFDHAGNELKAFNAKDGHGMKMLQRSGIEVAFITGRTSRVVTNRAAELGIEHVWQGSKDKGKSLQELLDRTDYKLEDIAYMGDDVIDLPVLRKVGLPMTVADAHDYVKKDCQWISTLPGGKGAVRQACEFIMQAQDTFDRAMQQYLV